MTLLKVLRVSLCGFLITSLLPFVHNRSIPLHLLSDAEGVNQEPSVAYGSTVSKLSTLMDNNTLAYTRGQLQRQKNKLKKDRCYSPLVCDCFYEHDCNETDFSWDNLDKGKLKHCICKFQTESSSDLIVPYFSCIKLFVLITCLQSYVKSV